MWALASSLTPKQKTVRYLGDGWKVMKPSFFHQYGEGEVLCCGRFVDSCLMRNRKDVV
jgi:hypothetical protein